MLGSIKGRDFSERKTVSETWVSETSIAQTSVSERKDRSSRSSLSLVISISPLPQTRYREAPGILTGRSYLHNLLLGNQLVLGNLNLGYSGGREGSREGSAVRKTSKTSVSKTVISQTSVSKTSISESSIAQTGVSETSVSKRKDGGSGSSLGFSLVISLSLLPGLSFLKTRYRVTEGVSASSSSGLQLDCSHGNLDLLGHGLHDVGTVGVRKAKASIA